MGIDWTEVKTASLKLASIMIVGAAAITMLKFAPMAALGIVVGWFAATYKTVLFETVVKPMMRIFSWTI